MEYLLALALLTSPDVPVNDLVDSPTASLFSELRNIAINMELLDERETRYIFTADNDFVNDVTILRKRYESLNDAPFIRDASRFSSRFYISNNKAFNRRYRDFLEKQLQSNPDWAAKINEAMLDADELYAIWDAANDAQTEYYFITTRRAALKKLRSLISAEDFENGILPPCVPIWRFTEDK